MGPTIDTFSRASRNHSRCKDQRGSILLLVLAVVLVLSIVVVGLLRMSSSTRRLSNRMETDSRTLHQIDGRLEEAINVVRDDDATCPPGTETRMIGLSPSPFEVYCQGLAPAPSDPDPPPQRTVDFEVRDSGDVVGLGRVRVHDEINSERLVGYSIEVCDWLLGKQAIGQSFKGCS